MMTAQEIRKKYLEFFKDKDHKVTPRANLVPQNDSTTLFTGSGMQPLVPYLLGEKHPSGNRLANSQTCFRAEDMDEVGDNRHTTFFEMLGNWSLGDYYKEEQLTWFWQFLTKELKLNPEKLYVTCFIGDDSTGVQKDFETAKIWKKLLKSAGIDAKEVEIGSAAQGAKKGMGEGRIFYYDAQYNWWSRGGTPSQMAIGEPGGPDSEVFYNFGTPHDKKLGKNCHPNCECGRYLEIGNSVFMAYKKTGSGFTMLPRLNVDFGGGLERLAAASINSPDVFETSLLKPIISGLELISGESYGRHPGNMRVIADHLRAATFLAVDGVEPSNKEQGYVLRRLLRRAIRFAFELAIEEHLCERITPIIVDIYKNEFPEVKANQNEAIKAFIKEETIFRQTLKNGLRRFEKFATTGAPALSGEEIFKLYDTYGFPSELSLEEAYRRGLEVDADWKEQFENLMRQQRHRSQTASAGMFKGGLADHSLQVVKYHTATHLMYQALKEVLGDHVVQRGSNITAERTRFDFSHPQKMTPEQIEQVEKIVNQKIEQDLPVSWKEESTKQALKSASGAFGDKYGEKVKVYVIGNSAKPFSQEICGGPHVEHTGQIGEGGMRFKITKEESSSAGVRRIKAVLL